MKNLLSQAGGAAFLARNLVRARTLQPIPSLLLSRVALSGLPRHLIPSFDRVHESLRAGRSLGDWRSRLYDRVGSRLVVVAVNEDLEVVGFDMYYFEAANHERRHIHEAYVGVLPEYRSLGIATAMRRMALTAFSSGGVQAVTTDIAPGNAASLVSAGHLGFVVQSRSAESLRMHRELPI